MERHNVEDMKKKGLPLEYICRSLLYSPEKSAFVPLPCDKLGTGMVLVFL
jgi:DNA (cytosine-5)-methyltransferase 1